MKLAMDVHHEGEGARVAAVSFDDWGAAEPLKTYTSLVPRLEKPVRGELDLRDLPCLMQLLHEHALEPELIVIDGFVHLDADDTPGLGAHLFHALGGRVAVVGLSKTAMAVTPAQFEVMREEETRPLVVTCAGIDLGAAKMRVRAMHGRKRVPTLMKRVARIAKGTAD